MDYVNKHLIVYNNILRFNSFTKVLLSFFNRCSSVSGENAFNLLRGIQTTTSTMVTSIWFFKKKLGKFLWSLSLYYNNQQVITNTCNFKQLLYLKKFIKLNNLIPNIAFMSMVSKSIKPNHSIKASETIQAWNVKQRLKTSFTRLY